MPETKPVTAAQHVDTCLELYGSICQITDRRRDESDHLDWSTVKLRAATVNLEATQLANWREHDDGKSRRKALLRGLWEDFEILRALAVALDANQANEFQRAMHGVGDALLALRAEVDA